MARPYRKVAAAVEELRRASGILAAVDSRDEVTAWRAVGMLDVIISRVLEGLQADRVVPASGSYEAGYDALAAMAEPLPFPEG